jgi:hypothetical protein
MGGITFFGTYVHYSHYTCKNVVFHAIYYVIDVGKKPDIVSVVVQNDFPFVEDLPNQCVLPLVFAVYIVESKS